MSVNSGIEAKDFYLKAGFELTDNLIKKDGILYYPMVKKEKLSSNLKTMTRLLSLLIVKKTVFIVWIILKDIWMI